MNMLNELISNDDVNVWELVGTKTPTKILSEIVKTASTDDLKSLIVKFDGHQLFNFMEDFIAQGMAENMNESEYWDFIDEAGL